MSAVVSANHPFGVGVDGAGNLYYADPDYSLDLDSNGRPTLNDIKKWNAATQQVSLVAGLALTSNGYSYGGSALSFSVDRNVAVSQAGNVYLSYLGNIQETSAAQVPAPTALTVPYGSGTGSLPPVLPTNTLEFTEGVLQASSDQSWLTLGAVANGVVPYSYTPPGSASSTAHISITGVQSSITQVIAVDAFTGTGTRTGTLTVAGLTFTVTQYGVNDA